MSRAELTFEEPVTAAGFASERLLLAGSSLR